MRFWTLIFFSSVVILAFVVFSATSYKHNLDAHGESLQSLPIWIQFLLVISVIAGSVSGFFALGPLVPIWASIDTNIRTFDMLMDRPGFLQLHGRGEALRRGGVSFGSNK